MDEALEEAVSHLPYAIVAEDDDDLCEAVAQSLQREGFAVQCVPDGELLIDKIMVRVPDVIITDHRMPALSGIEVLEELADAGCKVPIILITGMGREVCTIAQCLGAAAVFEKPFDPSELAAAARYHLELP